MGFRKGRWEDRRTSRYLLEEWGITQWLLDSKCERERGLTKDGGMTVGKEGEECRGKDGHAYSGLGEGGGRIGTGGRGGLAGKGDGGLTKDGA